MIRLTTPLHRFTFPQDPSTYKKILITYAQENEIVLEKTEEDMDFKTNNIGQLSLSQEETRLFKPFVDVKIQIRVLTNDDNAYASDYITMRVKDVLNEDILE